MALALDLQRVVAGGFSLPALQWLGFVEVASQTPAGIGAPDPQSSKDKDSQKLPEEAGRDSSPCRLSRHVADGRGAPEEPQPHHLFEEQGGNF